MQFRARSLPGPEPVALGQGPVRLGGRPGIAIAVAGSLGGRKAHRAFRQIQAGHATGRVWQRILRRKRLGPAGGLQRCQQHKQ